MNCNFQRKFWTLLAVIILWKQAGSALLEFPIDFIFQGCIFPGGFRSDLKITAPCSDPPTPTGWISLPFLSQDVLWLLLTDHYSVWPQEAFWPCSDQVLSILVMSQCPSQLVSVIKGRELRISWQALAWKCLAVGACTFSKTGSTLPCHGDRTLLNSSQQQKIGNIEVREGKYGPRGSGGGTYFFITVKAHLVWGEKT